MNPSSSNKPVEEKRIDCHVHWVDNRNSGSGCQLNPRGLHQYLYRFMISQLGLSSGAMKGDLKSPYLHKLLHDIRTSSIDQVALFAMDHSYSESAARCHQPSVYYVPNDCVLDLAETQNEFLPVVSIHPSRPDALDELDKCLERGAIMLKLLPNVQNVDYANKRVNKFWERVSEARLPLITHTGSEHTLPVIDASYASVEKLPHLLDIGVTVIAAHAATPNAPWDRDELPLLFKLMDQHPNLYADTSAFNTPYRIRYLKKILASEHLDRFIHGSDYPVPSMPHWGLLQQLISWDQFRHLQKLHNPLQRDYLIKKWSGFPESHFTRFSTIIRRA